AQYFLGAAADAEIGHVHEADHALWVDDVGGALRDARFRVEDAEAAGQLALDVREHGEGQRPELLAVTPPGEVHELTVDAHAQQLGIARLEFLVELAEGGDFGRAHEGEILGPEEHDAPLAREALVVHGLEGVLGVAGDDARKRELRKLLADADHGATPY